MTTITLNTTRNSERPDLTAHHPILLFVNGSLEKEGLSVEEVVACLRNAGVTELQLGRILADLVATGEAAVNSGIGSEEILRAFS